MIRAEKFFSFSGVDDMCLTEDDIRFGWDGVNTGLIIPRDEEKRRTFKFLRLSCPETRMSNMEHVRLEGWKVMPQFHAKMHEYGTLFQVSIEWNSTKFPLYIVSIDKGHEVDNFPHQIPCGRGPAFTVAQDTFNVFRDFAREKTEPGEALVGVRLLFHVLVLKNRYPGLSLSEFCLWSEARIISEIEWFTGREDSRSMIRMTAGDACLISHPGVGLPSCWDGKYDASDSDEEAQGSKEVDISVEVVGEVRAGPSSETVGREDRCVLMWEKEASATVPIEAEPVKAKRKRRSGNSSSGEEKQIGQSPTLAEKTKALNDVDERSLSAFPRECCATADGCLLPAGNPGMGGV